MPIDEQVTSGIEIRPIDPSATEIGLEEVVGIVEVADDLLEAREVFHQVPGQIRPGNEESGEAAVFDRPCGVRVVAALGEGDDVLVAENLEMGVRKVFAEQADSGEGEDEVPDGPAADDEDARFHGMQGRRWRDLPPVLRRLTPD